MNTTTDKPFFTTESGVSVYHVLKNDLGAIRAHHRDVIERWLEGKQS